MLAQYSQLVVHQFDALSVGPFVSTVSRVWQ